MANKFKNIFLVCLDYGDDLNHVVARNPSLKKARHAANLAKKRWPEQEVYITVEKTLEQNPLENEDICLQVDILKKEKCACGKQEGACLSNLSCQCPAIAICKQMKLQIDPFETETFSSSTSSLELVEINVVKMRRGIVEVVIPDWDPEETIGLSPNEIPGEIMPYLEEGVVLEAEVNLDAVSAEDLILQNLQLVYEEDDEDEDDEDEDDEDYEDNTEENKSSQGLNMSYYQYMNPLPEDDGFPELPGEDEEDGDEEDETEFLEDEFEENSSFEE